jgi:hypothetical protein
MNYSYKNLNNQLKRNSVAFISVIIAVSSLSYNTWRNEKTEDNRNQRFAAFEVLLKLGELQQAVFHSHYDGEDDASWNPRAGWTYVLTIRDLSLVSGEVMTAEADNLYSVWQENWHYLGKEQSNVDAINDGIEQMRDTTVSVITSLQ